jgi:hypothetical protein
LGIGLVAGVGCGSKVPVDVRDPGALPIQGDNVTLYYDPGMMPCAGTLAHLDAAVAAIGRYLDLDLPVGDPIPYYYTQDLLPCSSGAAGCTIGPPQAVLSCWATKPTLVHELVHAVKWRAIGLTNAFLEEGLAVSLGQLDFVGKVESRDPDAELLTPDKLPPDDYGVAGDFVSYLLTRFGPGPFRKLVASVRPGDAVEAIEAAFVAVYGETMGALRADRAQSPLAFYGNRIDLPECQAEEPDPNIGRGAAVSETVDCATNTVGTVGTRYVPFEVAADGIYSVTVQHDAASTFGLFACGGGPALWSADLGASPLVVGHLHAGRYVFELDAGSTSPETFSITVAPVVLGTWPTCASLAPVAVPSGTESVYLFSMDDGALEVPFVLEDAATLVSVHPVVNLSSSRAQVCTSGCGAACTDADEAVDEPTLPAGAGFTLRASFAGQPKLVGVNLQKP